MTMLCLCCESDSNDLSVPDRPNGDMVEDLQTLLKVKGSSLTDTQVSAIDKAKRVSIMGRRIANSAKQSHLGAIPDVNRLYLKAVESYPSVTSVDPFCEAGEEAAVCDKPTLVHSASPIFLSVTSAFCEGCELTTNGELAYLSAAVEGRFYSFLVDSGATASILGRDFTFHPNFNLAMILMSVYIQQTIHLYGY